MNFDIPLLAIFASTVTAATPLIYAALGETVVEKAGVLNLGIEGMMLVGAVSGFAATLATGSPIIGFFAAGCAGVLMSLIFAVLTLSLQANQVATGLALTLFGIGLSAFVGHDFAGTPIAGLKKLPIPFLSDIPIIGQLLFSYDAMVYGSILLFVAVQWFLAKSYAGLKIRAIGESPTVAHEVGHPVIWIRYCAVMFGGATAGIAGAYLSLVQTPMWVEGMTAGKGWIALALVVFGTWKPLRVVLGAYLFGGVTVMQLFAQGFGFGIPSEFLSMLPYVATIVVLVIICRDPKTILLNQPLSLGKSFHPGS
ncbi:ABC transporter permease [Undibacterium sp. 5I1]|uniref:ABC transporter permease n=1 Tax=unclassified Undibacterium TaxID=2630295 RepID=UPI002AB3F52F|nr:MULTISPECIES: ABC transporter permease [unclassified Undibacterium]MDY7540008.1 ABC transporter permease [Undibacterium sp. 5I1]MEB0232353.1 ABC transporter permease [Undibacterium sp. 10I3]MEB0257855.1 ABC transporter permease [Undibacterium sp. 5I1]